MQTETIVIGEDYIKIRHAEHGVNVWIDGSAFFGADRQAAITNAVARLEAIIDALQSTPSPESMRAVTETKGASK